VKRLGATWPVFLPDGQRLLYLAKGGDRGQMVMLGTLEKKR
jgi:hypothetical protein